jgi:hypothetical protein
MANQATIGKGSKLMREDSPGGGVYTQVARVSNIDWPRQTGEFDGTTFESENAEYSKDLVDNGTLTADLYFVPGESSQESLEDDYEDDDTGTRRKYRFVQNDTAATYREFEAFVNSFQQTIPVRGLQTARVGFRVTGTLTRGTGG